MEAPVLDTEALSHGAVCLVAAVVECSSIEARNCLHGFSINASVELNEPAVVLASGDEHLAVVDDKSRDLTSS